MNLINRILSFPLRLVVYIAAIFFFCLSGAAYQADNTIPRTSKIVVSALDSAQWSPLEEGIDVIRAITETGIVMTAYKVSSEEFEFSIVPQLSENGSRAREIGEQEGAVLVSNAGFFAQNLKGNLYPIGYLRLDGDLHSKGWHDEGGILSWGKDGSLQLTPTHIGIPRSDRDALQSRPMFIEPGGRWAMGSNLGEAKNRTVLCKLPDGDVILAVVTRVGLSLFEAGWIMRDRKDGGFFGCSAALALDGGRSTQVWYSGSDTYSFSGAVPVHNFLVISARDN